MTKRIFRFAGLLALILLWVSQPASAQKRKKKDNEENEVAVSIYDVDTLINPIPLQRQLWHDGRGHIDEFQKRIDEADGALDGKVTVKDDTVFSRLFTESLLKDVDHLEIMIENLPPELPGWDARLEHNNKLRYLQQVDDLLKRYLSDPAPDGYFYKRLTTNLREFIIAHYEGRMSSFIDDNINVYTLNNCNQILDTGNMDRQFLYREMGRKEPSMMIDRLSEFAQHSYACDIIAAAARVVPNKVFNYATSTSYIRYAVERCPDPLVQTIVKIARFSKSPLRAMPFLNDIFTGRKTIQEIDVITANEDLFYQNLVRLKLENVGLAGDTYTDELHYRGLRYIREMNDLHEEKPPVRFKCINGLAPEVLYFIMVYGQDEIYTSSFVGTFNRMMERMGNMHGDQLLDMVHRDKFRTFIRMCAGYNTLDRFLGTMDSTRRISVMTDFIAGLGHGKEDDLEDAVDVADAFGSIKDENLANFLRNEVKYNYEQSYREGSKKGVIVYGLLATLFEGTKNNDNSDAVQAQSSKLKLPPINLVPYNKLTSDQDKVVYEQFFFYGDEDGAASYNSFLTNFKDRTKWAIEKTEYWTKITSISGKPIVVFANMPLEEPEDEVAVAKTCEYLAANNIHPTVLVHRGHSYHLPLTIDRISKENKIVILGSCGGYHNLSTVLAKAPNANIISSKQTGAMSINEPIIKTINDQISAGQDINWINTWAGLSGHFDQVRGPYKEMFDDYVPPHKNLGAIFIKAYRRLFNADM
ncbi:MAG: hypothetical protein KDC07_01945 [Chitinophagaceae bacterium]|nr:hypothetical protein [Chitinophagaceae bacterium]MCB9046954.1 hypothetical protein [Chitinophagales bacterium]